MKRRNFVKKSVAAAIVAATPLALTGLVQAAGGGPQTTTTLTTTIQSTGGEDGVYYCKAGRVTVQCDGQDGWQDENGKFALCHAGGNTCRCKWTDEGWECDGGATQTTTSPE